MKTDHPDRPVTSGSYSRNLVSSASTRSAPTILPSHDFSLDRHNLGLHRPRKLTPLEAMPKSNQIRIPLQNSNDKKQNRALHMSVNYNSNGSHGWKQTLDPIIQSRREDPENRKFGQRKNTFSISSQEDRESLQPSPSSNNEMCKIEF